MIAPIFEEMSNTFEDVVFMKVDVDDNAETAATYNVSAMPTFVSSSFSSILYELANIFHDTYNVWWYGDT